MSQSPSLSFGPAWMRPELTKNQSQESTRSFSQIQSQQNPSNSNGSKAIYSIDELLKVWSQIQNELQKEGFKEKYRQLNPIRQLVHQVEIDREQQKQQLQQLNYNSNHYSNNSGSANGGSRDDPKVALELTQQLNEINTWAKNENTGIDIAGIISNVTRSQSPFVSKPLLVNRESSFSSLNNPLNASTSHLNFNSLGNNNNQSTRSFSNHFQPQAPVPTQPEMIPPQLINWYYLDPVGNKQGPFDGVQMHGWFFQGYLSTDLKIRREDETNFYSLQDFITSIGNFTEPFLTPLPSLNTPPPTSTTSSLQHQFNNLSFEQQAIPNLFGNDHSNSFINQPQAQIPALSNLNSGWSSNNLASQQLSGRSSPWVTQTTLSSTNNDIIPTTDFRINQSPFLNNSSILLDQSNSFQNNNSFNNNQDDEIFNQIQSQVLNNVLIDNSSTKQELDTSKQLPKQEIPIEKPVLSQQKPKSQTIASTQIEEKPPIVEKKVQSKPKREILKRPTTQTSIPVQQVVQKQAPAPIVTQQPSELNKISEPKVAVSSPASQLAPWAKKSSAPTTPTLTINQIQQLEAEESKRQIRLKQEKDKNIAAQLLANAEKLIKDEKVVNALPSGASWGNTNQSKSSGQTLLDIQREEAELEAAKAASLASLAKANNTISSSGLNSNIKPVTALPHATKNSFASIASSTSTSNTNAWTTVTRKAAPKATQIGGPAKISSSSSKISPDVLRSVSASTSSINSSSSGYAKISPRQEFLSWCRSTIKLNKGINKDDILEILLMLPTIGSESNEIIADTIYSNSSIMDGRRFAAEFLKRRKAVEDQVNDGLTWIDALNINPEDEDDGWDFQVVGKKNKRRN